MRIAVVCDVGPLVGAGHAMRCLALVAALRDEGTSVAWFSPVTSLGWLGGAELGNDEVIAVTGTGSTERAVLDWCADLVLVDSYLRPDSFGRSIFAAHVPIVSINDPSTPRRPASLNLLPGFGLDQGAGGGSILAGPRYVLIRREIRAARGPKPAIVDACTAEERLRVGVLMGGAGAAEVTWAIARALDQVDLDFAIQVNVPSPVDGNLPAVARHQVEIHRAGTSYWEVLRRCHIVVSAAGVSAWELACLGIPMGLLLVADNQSENYWGMTSRGWAIGLGTVAQVLADPEFLTRGVASSLLDRLGLVEMASRAWAAVDGGGVDRVAAVIQSRSGRVSA